MTDNGWDEYQLLVLDRLNSHTEQLKIISSRMEDMRVEIALLKVRSSIWGAVAGAITVALAGIFS